MKDKYVEHAEKQIQQLLAKLKSLNIVAEVILQPKTPLAAGNYEPVVSFRDLRAKKYLTIADIDEYIQISSISSDVIGQRKLAIMDWAEGERALVVVLADNNLHPLGIMTEETYQELMNEDYEDVDIDDKPTSG